MKKVKCQFNAGTDCVELRRWIASSTRGEARKEEKKRKGSEKSSTRKKTRYLEEEEKSIKERIDRNKMKGKERKITN